MTGTFAAKLGLSPAAVELVVPLTISALLFTNSADLALLHAVGVLLGSSSDETCEMNEITGEDTLNVLLFSDSALSRVISGVFRTLSPLTT